MKFIAAVLCAAGQAAWVSASGSATVASVTPVQKVIQLMENMAVRGKDEKHKEQVQFAAYKQFCDDTQTDKTRVVKEAGAKIEQLAADSQLYEVTATKLSKEVEVHDADIHTWQGDQRAARNVRGIEKTDYEKTHKDYSESVDALGRAIGVLREQPHDRSQAVFAQVSSLAKLRLIPEYAKQTIDTFLQSQGGQPAGSELRGAHAYEFHSSGVVEMLDKLKDKFVDERASLEHAESNAKNAHNLLQQDLTAQIDQAAQDRTEKTTHRAKKLEMKAGAEGEKSDTQKVKADDEHYLADLTATCTQKASDFESRQQLRTEELEAIAKAIEIISSASVQGHSETHLPELFQRTAASVLAQMRRPSAVATAALPQARAAAFLERQAGALNSRVLAALAQHASDDPFVKVRTMIKDLVVRLMEEASEEAEHQGWCNNELATNEKTRREKTSALETLHAEIDQFEASIAKLAEEIAQLTEESANLNKHVAEATTLRIDEKKENQQAIADAKEAQAATAQAINVLKEFYAKAGDATSLVQHGQQPVSPATFDSAYTGMQSENGGVIGMLEVVESDFARLEAETAASEAFSQNAYDAFMTDSKMNLEAKKTAMEHKTTKKQDQKQAMTTKSEDRDGTQTELNAALAFFDELKPSCVETGVSYEERVQHRKQEVESLQEALRILSGEELA